MDKDKVEQVRALIASPEWPAMTDEDRFQALQAIDPEAEVYEVSWAKAKGFGQEHYPTIEEALERANAIYNGGKKLFAGTYVDVNDLGGNNYTSLYVR